MLKKTEITNLKENTETKKININFLRSTYVLPFLLISLWDE